MNFIDGLPKSEGCDTILAMVDKYSKYGHFITLKQHFVNTFFPDEANVHPVFWVSYLKLFHSLYTLVFQVLPRVTDLSSTSVFPVKVLHRRLVCKGHQAVPQVLIQWSRLPVESAI